MQRRSKGHSADLRHQLRQVGHYGGVRHAQTLRQVAQLPAGGNRIGDHVVLSDGGPAAGRLNEPRQGPERRGFPGPVRSHQSDDLTGRDLERQGLERQAPAI